MPDRVQAWREVGELSRCTLMRNGYHAMRLTAWDSPLTDARSKVHLGAHPACLRADARKQAA